MAYYVEEKAVRKGKVMQKYNVGQMLIASENMDVKTEITNENKTIKKGTKSWVMAAPDSPALFIEDGSILCLDNKDTKIVGVDIDGLAEFIFARLCNRSFLKEMMENYNESAEQVKEIISEALNDLGFCEGNTECDE